MASVQELLLAAEAKSPFLKLIRGFGQGYQTAESQALERTKTLMAIDKERQQQEQRAKMQKEIELQLKAQRENEVKAAFNNSTSSGKPVLPAQKLETLQTEIKQDEYGNYSRSFKVVEAPKEEKVKYSESTYFDDKGNKRAGRFNPSTGDHEYRPTDPIVEKPKVTEEKDETELNVPGWGRSNNVRPTKEEAKQARQALADFDAFKTGISELKALIKKHGSTNMMGKGSADAGSLATGLKLNLKNIAQLGVMSASDAELLAQQIINPNEFGSIKITTDGAIEQLDSTLRQAQTKLKAGMAAKGYSDQGWGNGQNSVVTNGKIRVSNGKETLLIDAADEVDAANDGYRRVE